MSPASRDFYAGDLFGELYDPEPQPRRYELRAYVPGMLACGTASLAAAFLAGHYGFPIVVLGLLVGLSLSFISELESTAPGLDLVSRFFLQAGIAMLGLQVTLGQVADLGPQTFAGLLLVMLAAFVAAMVTARLVGESSATGLLAGGATAICGASAALAIYGVLGRDRIDQARFAVTLVGVSIASAIAMSAYPALAGLAGLSDSQAGFLIGASVHDVAQAIGGAYSYSDAAGADATVVKLSRVALLVPTVTVISWILSRRERREATTKRRPMIPWFIAIFVLVFILNSLVPIPAAVQDGALTLSKALLLLAVTATAMRSRLGLLLDVGWRTLAPVATASLTSFAVAFVVARSVV